MINQVDPDFQRKLDQFNSSQGGPSKVEICWDMRRNRWCVFAIPVDYGHHPLSKTWVTPKLLRPFLDGSGRTGVFLFTWQDANGEYLPLDDRIFQALHFADSFTSKDHFEKSIEEPEMQRELSRKKDLRDIAYGAKNYWFNLDKQTSIPGRGNWRRARGLATHT